MEMGAFETPDVDPEPKGCLSQSDDEFSAGQASKEEHDFLGRVSNDDPERVNRSWSCQWSACDDAQIDKDSKWKRKAPEH